MIKIIFCLPLCFLCSVPVYADYTATVCKETNGISYNTETRTYLSKTKKIEYAIVDKNNKLELFQIDERSVYTKLGEIPISKEVGENIVIETPKILFVYDKINFTAKIKNDNEIYVFSGSCETPKNHDDIVIGPLN